VEGLNMQRTYLSALSKFALGSFVVVFAIAKLLMTTSDVLLPINIGSPIALGILVAGMLFWAILISSRLPRTIKSDTSVLVQASSNPLPPLVATRTVAFALAGSRVGALILGGYLGLALNSLAKSAVLAYENHAKLSAISSVLGLFMVLISLWVERKCSPPNPTSASE
jgi:hypothetical protein